MGLFRAKGHQEYEDYKDYWGGIIPSVLLPSCLPAFSRNLYSVLMFWLDLAIAGLVFFTAILFVTFFSGFFLHAPFVPTSRKVIHTVFDFAGASDGDAVFDLGAGDARVLILAGKKFPNSRLVGCELTPTVWFWGKLMLWCTRTKAEFHLCDLLKLNVSDADCVFLYLMPGIMKKIEKKFDRELKPGTTVISYAFHFPNREPVDTLEVPWLQGKRKLRKYVW